MQRLIQSTNKKTIKGNEEAEKAFISIIQAFLDNRGLHPHDIKKPLIMVVDASDIATGALLLQNTQEIYDVEILVKWYG
jgi:RNase H-like domain found in reverse transcriptase